MHSIAFLFIGWLAVVPSAAAEVRPPNIICVMADELGCYEVSYMGNPWFPCDCQVSKMSQNQ